MWQVQAHRQSHPRTFEDICSKYSGPRREARGPFTAVTLEPRSSESTQTAFAGYRPFRDVNRPRPTYPTAARRLGGKWPLISSKKLCYFVELSTHVSVPESALAGPSHDRHLRSGGRVRCGKELAVLLCKSRRVLGSANATAQARIVVAIDCQSRWQSGVGQEAVLRVLR